MRPWHTRPGEKGGGGTTASLSVGFVDLNKPHERTSPGDSRGARSVQGVCFPRDPSRKYSTRPRVSPAVPGATTSRTHWPCTRPGQPPMWEHPAREGGEEGRTDGRRREASATQRGEEGGGRRWGAERSKHPRWGGPIRRRSRLGSSVLDYPLTTPGISPAVPSPTTRPTPLLPTTHRPRPPGALSLPGGI